MAQTWSVIRGDTETQISGGTLSYRVSVTNVGAPPKRNLSTRGPFQHGESFYGFRYDKRIISLVFFADAASLSLADAQRDDIYNLWRGVEGETVTLKVMRDDGAVRLIDGEVINVIDFPDAVGDRYGGSQRFAVQLECHNPFWRKQAATVTSLTVNGTTTIPYAGQFPAEPIINIVGPITNPVVTQVYTGKKLDFTGTTIAAGNNYQIDTRYGYKTVLDGSAVNRIANLTNDSDLADFNVSDFPDTASVAWQARAAAEQNTWQSVAYGNGVWVAVAGIGTNRVMRSTNGGVTWSAVASPSLLLSAVAYGNGVWIGITAFGNTVIRSTDDGVTWTQITTYPNSTPLDKAALNYGNGVWIAITGPYATNSTLRSTDDGVTWSTFSLPELNVWLSVAYGNGVWVAVANNGTNRVMRSTDGGVTWSAVAAAEQNAWRSVAYGNGVWVAVANLGANRVMRSTDGGVTWSAVAAAEQTFWESVAYGNGVWVAVAEGGTNQVMRSAELSQDYTVAGTGTSSATAVTMTYNELYLGI